MSEYDYKYAVYIGRFQPPHNAHIEAMREALKVAENLIVLVGSCDAAPSVRNPWGFAERSVMIIEALQAVGVDTKRVYLLPLRDYFYNETAWEMEVRTQVESVTGDTQSVCLMVHFKEQSQEYLRSLPWPKVPIPHGASYPLNATDIRSTLFHSDNPNDETWSPDTDRKWSAGLPKAVAERIRKWIHKPAYSKLRDEYRKISAYKAQWKGLPYPPVFVTADALVIKSGHLLVVRRKFVPGMGLLALPGGFVKPDETIQEAALRELKEETRINVPKLALQKHITQFRVFDHPDRDLRGRVITHCCLIDLGDGSLPKVRGDDDAEHAIWVPFRNVLERPTEFYADHAQIIYQYLMEYRWTPNSVQKRPGVEEILAFVRDRL